jgi:hypothetical protein
MGDTPPSAGLARPLLDRTLAEWRKGVVLRALLTGFAIALVAAAVLLILDQLIGLPSSVRAALRPLPLVLGLLPLGRGIARALPRPADGHIALLAEEHRPELGYHLTTLVGATSSSSTVGGAFLRAAERHVREIDGPVVPTAAGTAARRLGVAALVFSAVFLLVPGGGAEVGSRWGRLAGGPASGIGTSAGALGRTSDTAARTFRDVRIQVQPPAYTGAAPFDATGASPVIAQVGSRLSVEADSPEGASSVEVRLLGAASPVMSGAEERIRAAFDVGEDTRGLELVGFDAGGAVLARHVIALDVRPDPPPVVELVEPQRDLVLATAAGSVSVRATARDDHAVAAFALEWILTRGSGESFSSTEGRSEFGTIRRDGPAQSGSYPLDVAALGLEPGDVLHIRAVADDGNTVTGPGRGTSRTRVIRIVRAGEEDQANTLIGFPIEVEGDPVLTQRMIVLLTERLLERAPSLPADQMRSESEDIARAQARVRERFNDVVYARSAGEPADPADAHDHDADPALAVNAKLIPALDAMFEAERHLHLSELRAALPPEYRALELVQAAREAERVFVRGVQTVPPVDIDAARGTGQLRDVQPAVRSSRPSAATAARHAARLAAAADALRSAPSAVAVLEISAAAVELLSDASVDPHAGALLARASAAATEGQYDLALSLVAQARALLVPPSGGTAAIGGDVRSAAGSAFLARLTSAGVDAPLITPRPPSPLAPFVFATARYSSGDWDSAPLVPANLIHSLALYTDVPVVPEGVIVDLASTEIFRYPLLFLTGHLPVQLTAAEAANVREYVDRGGFLFVDDHNHDIDGAFHRTVTAELRRVFGEDDLRALPSEHELYRTFFVFENGPPTTSHELNGWGDGLVHDSLFAIERNGRIGVLYSNKDYASEWSYHAVNKRFLGVDNTRFGVNVILYALTR